MTSTAPKNTYPWDEYEAAHQHTFSTPNIPIKRVIPPGVTEEAFDQAIEALAAVVGKDQVFVGDALSHYIDPFDIWDDDESKRKVPGAAVVPASVEEVRAVLHVANKFNIPLWTFSRGKNLGYGGPAPRINGSVALDLHRMNRILEVNDEYSYCVVEPGVSWKQLIDYCAEHKKKVWPSTPSLSWGSVTGNTLDRGTGFGTHFNHHQSISGLEVLLADGDVVRTGQFSIDGSPNAFISKFTYGPSIEGLFLQSNLGVVTKLSLWMTPTPPAFMECTLSADEFKHIEPMVDLLGPMRQNGLIPSCVWFMGCWEILAARGKRVDFWDGPGPVPTWRMRELCKELELPYWTARWGFWGPKRVIQAQFDEIKELVEKTQPALKLNGTIFSGDNGGLVDNKSIPEMNAVLLTGQSSLFSLPTIQWALPKDGSGKGAHGDYAPHIPNSGKLTLEWIKKSYECYEKRGIEPMIDFFMHERHILMVNMFMYDQQNSRDRKAVYDLYHDFHKLSKDRCYGMYRAHVNYMDLIAGHSSFNNYAYNRFVEKIKDAVDPNGILSPGKSGIWPSRYRHLREAHEAKKPSHL
ncbi:Vanillyl-alcohol oxidase [Fusarium pseudoanthophilum]|uniref:Vanillyl-alcohol oxidase n=1 Tax=Fusarium pseudoanthophilum TaxID=48495 RepID=A0A8H5P394_9HYPO|nr:Vanillyl-alcohol oxidase [Fusarium pseudoanthophilum]